MGSGLSALPEPTRRAPPNPARRRPAPRPHEARRAVAVGVLLLTLAPSWLPAASAQLPSQESPAPLPSDPLARLLDDLGRFLGDALGRAREVAPSPGEPRLNLTPAQQLAEEALRDARPEPSRLDDSPVAVLLREDFEEGSLLERGWGQEVLRGEAPWGIADSVDKTLARADGAVITPEFEGGGNPIAVRDGRRAAAVLNEAGRYGARVDARLVSPVIDLRYVRGASARTDEGYELLTRDATLGQPYREFLAFWRTFPGALSHPTLHSQSLQTAYGWLLSTPPSQLQRLYLGPYHNPLNAYQTACAPAHLGAAAVPCGPAGDTFFINPLSPRYGLALINLTFHHRYDLADGLGQEVPGAFLDGAFLEARAVRPDGTPGPWEHLRGDLLFETQVDSNTTSPSLGAGGGPSSPLSSALPPASGVVERGLGLAQGDEEYSPQYSFYNGRVQLRALAECYGSVPTRRVDCLPDAPAWVNRSGEALWKSHFTLNRYAGHQIQLAWRLHSGSGSIGPRDFGWFVDAVKVEALLPARDPGVQEALSPRPGDVVPARVPVQPSAVVRNHGYQPVEGVLVNFTIEEAPPVLGPEGLSAALTGDAGSLGEQALAAGVPPRAPGLPGQTLAQAQQGLRRPRTLLTSSVVLDRIPALGDAVATSPVACVCPAGAYRMRVEAAALPLGGGGPASAPERVEDGSRANNLLVVAFEARDVASARLRLSLPVSSVFTDLDEPKVLRVDLENTGNLDLAGTVSVLARALDPATLQTLPGAREVRAGNLAVGPGELPAGQRLAGGNPARDNLTRELAWQPTGLPPGVYRLEARFQAEPGLEAPAEAAALAYIRATPAPYFPGDGRNAEDFEPREAPADGFSRDRLPYANFDSAGWRSCDGCSTDPSKPLRLPLGAVTTSRTWNATGADGPLAELSALALLAGAAPGAQLSASPVPGVAASARPAVVRVPAVTFDGASRTAHVPPLVVELPSISLKALGQTFTLPPATLQTPAGEVPMPGGAATPGLDAPPRRAATEPVELRTPPLGLSTPAGEVVGPPVLVRVPGIEVTWDPPGVRVPPVEVVVPSLFVRVEGAPQAATPPAVLPTPDFETPAQPLPGLPGRATPPQELATRELSVQTPSIPPADPDLRAVVRFNATHLQVCYRSYGFTENCTLLPNPDLARYDYPERLLSSLVNRYAGHSLLNDYYLAQRVDLRDCKLPACRPTLSFWHHGRFAWRSATEREEVPLPQAAGGPAKVPSTLQAVSPDQAQENRSRALVEVVVLDAVGSAGATPAVDVLPSQLQASPCQAAPLCGAPLEELCGPPAPALPSSPLPVLGQAWAERVQGSAPCAAALAGQEAPDARVLQEFREPVGAWRHEALDLGPYAGHRVALLFHYQTTLGRLQVNVTPGCNPYFPEAQALCVSNLDHWTLDNIRLSAASRGGAPLNLSDGFFDTAGDPDNNTDWRRWARFRLLRDAADANVLLPPSCFASVGPAQVVVPRAPAPAVGGPPPAPPAPPDPALPRAPDLACLAAAKLRGPAIAVDGRGWDIFVHGKDILQPNGQANPYYDGWFLDETTGFRTPGRTEAEPAHALRWGGPGSNGRYPPMTLYSLASSPLVSLAQAAQPTLSFLTNHSFVRTEHPGDNPAKGVTDGGAVFLARYAPDPACAAAGQEEQGCPLVFDRRVLLEPEGGYPAYVNTSLGPAVDISWLVPGSRSVNNGYTGRSGGRPLGSAWEGARFDLQQALAGLCLKAVSTGGTTTVRSFSQGDCEALKRPEGGVRWEGPRGFHAETRTAYLNLTGFDQDGRARYAVEFHAVNNHRNDKRTEDFGWAIDALRVGERLLANDVGVSRILAPRPGQVVGPGEEVLVRVNVTNFGLFTQRGLRVHFNVTQQGVQVFPPPEQGGSVVQGTSPSLGFPGLRDPNPQHDVTVAFEVPWTPSVPGLYTFNAWTEIAGVQVDGKLLHLADEDASNDLFSQVLEVREVHGVRLLGPGEFPDDDAVRPLVGTTEDARGVRVAVQNTGTVAEGLSLGAERALKVELTIEDEAGRAVLEREVAVDRVGPGRTVVADFGARAWLPPGGGLFTLRFKAVSAQDLLPDDNERAVRVLVLTRIFPRPGEAWQGLFQPAGQGWGNASRPGFGGAEEGWSFGEGDAYAPGSEGSLELREPADLTGFRSAVLAVRHRYDFEKGYDGGVVEVSPDGQRWEPLEPLGGYPAMLTTASPDVEHPESPGGAFTGASDPDGGGRPVELASVFPLGTAMAARTGPALVMRDDFESGGPAWEEVLDARAVPAGRAWWANKSVVWRPGALGFLAPDAPLTTLEGSKELYAMPRGLTIPPLEAPLVVEFDEWRALGLARRGSLTLQQGFAQPNAVEVSLERLEPGDPSKVTLALPVLPRTAQAQEPYGDHYLDWVRRSIVLPSSEVRNFANQSARLAFRLFVANSNNEPPGPNTPVNRAAGTGSPEDTDFASPHLGWAIAAPRLYFLAPRTLCDQAGLPYDRGKCILFEDALGYAGTDDPAVRQRWGAAWATQNYSKEKPLPDVLGSAEAGGDPLLEAGWQLVERVGLLEDKPAWDLQAMAPPRSGKGHVAEATGSGVGARLVRRLDLRDVVAEAVLEVDHSFKFADLRDVELNPVVPMHGAHGGGRVEVSRDGGETWEPVAPLVALERLEDGSVDKLAYTKALQELGFRRTYSRGSTSTAWQCARPIHAGCIDPEDPFRAPGGWVADDQPHAWEPAPQRGGHTPFAGVEKDPERNSPFGLGSMAFTGSTCEWKPFGSESALDPCGGAEDWERVRFDLSRYAGQEVLLAFHAWFPSHRYVRDAHVACTQPSGGACFPPFGDDEYLAPRDFWRIDDVSLAGSLFDGKPLLVRLRGFADGNGQRYGWDVLNVSLLGEQQQRNLAVALQGPVPGQPLLHARGAAETLLVNRGQEPLSARAMVLAEQQGSPEPLDNAGFEDWAGSDLEGWTLLDWLLARRGNVSAVRAAFPAEGRRALHLNVTAGGPSPGDPFELYQNLTVPPGHWVLSGLADLDARPGSGVGVRVVGALGDDGAPDPGTALPARAPGGAMPVNLSYTPFEVPFRVQGAPRVVRASVHANQSLLGASAGFAGTLTLDHLRLEPRAPPGNDTPFAHGGFEEGLEGWVLRSGQARVLRDKVEHDGGPASIPEGEQALGLEGTGVGAGDAELARSLELAPGRYRLSGLFASRGVNWSLARDEDSAGKLVVPRAGLEQSLQAGDLPRFLTGLRLWGDAAVLRAVDVQVLDARGTLLAKADGIDSRNGAFEFHAWRLHVPLEGQLRLLVKANATGPVALQVRSDDEYPRGTLSDLGTGQPAGRDLRAVFLGPVEGVSPLSLLTLGGGPSQAPGLGEVSVPQGAEYHLLQPVEVGGLPLRRPTNLTLRVVLPASGTIVNQVGPTEWRNYTLRQGELRARLLDAQGRALSEEAGFAPYALRVGEQPTLPEEAVEARLNFTNAFLPPGTTHVQVGLRAVNYTGSRSLRVAVVPLAGGERGSALLRDGQAVVAPVGAEELPLQLAMNLFYAREPLVTLDAEGAEGRAVQLAQPTLQAAVLGPGWRGAVPFAYDFTVPPGQPGVTLRVRLSQWQGEAILDALRLRALTSPAATFRAEVGPGQRAALLGSEAPAFEGVPGARYKLTLRAVATDAQGLVVEERLPGDNEASVLTGPALGEGAIVVARTWAEPNSINLTAGRPARLLALLRNEGSTGAELEELSASVLRQDGKRVFEARLNELSPRLEDTRLGPLEEVVVGWDFEPDPKLGKGMYTFRVEAQMQGAGSRPLPVHGSVPVYLGTDFHAQFGYYWPFYNSTTEDSFGGRANDGESLIGSTKWTTGALWNPKYPPENICNDPNRPGAGTQIDPCEGDAPTAEAVTDRKNWGWRKTDDLNLTPYRAITLGADILPNGQPVELQWILCCQGQQAAEGTIFSVVRSPAIPLAHMEHPFLVYADRHEFNGPHPEGTVYARLLDKRSDNTSEWRTFAGNACLTPSDISDWHVVRDHTNLQSKGYWANKWEVRSLDLRPLLDRALNETGDLTQWSHVQLCWHLEQQGPRDGVALIREWSVDDVMVTPYAMELGPRQRVPIQDDVDKRFKLVLRNRGQYTDTYQVRFEEESALPTRCPAHWQCELLDSEGRPLREVVVEPGEEAVVTLRVRIGVVPPTLARSGAFELAITAVSKASWLLRHTQRLLFEYEYPDRPNLRVAGILVNDATLSVDKPRTLDVVVQNTGRLPASQVELAVFDKMDPRFGVAPVELRRVDGSAVEPFDLSPGDVHMATVAWVPRLAGEHNLSAIVDPANRVREFDERDNSLVRPALVTAAEFPDLAVEAQVSEANPRPGDLVRVSLRILNQGTTMAQGVQLSVRAGVADLLPGEAPHVLPKGIAPGEAVSLEAAWRPAFPGEQTVIVRARTFAGTLERLDTGGDNVALLRVVVRSRGLHLALAEEPMVSPGVPAQALLRVTGREVQDTYRLTLVAPDDWVAQFAGLGQEARATVGQGLSADLPLEVLAPRGAEAGPHQLLVAAESENGTERVEAHLVMLVAARHGLSFAVEPEHLLQPGARSLPVSLANLGNAPDAAMLRASKLPEGWRLDPETIPLAPGALEAPKLTLRIPGPTPEGTHELALEAQGRSGEVLVQRALVHVLPREQLALELRGLPEVVVPGRSAGAQLVVRNDGNVPARAQLALEAPEGWRASLERDVLTLAPGEERALGVGLVVPANASSAAQALQALAVSGRAERYRAEAPIRPALADLALLDVEPRPFGRVRDGAVVTLLARVANRGEVPLGAPLAVYVDDALVAVEPVPVLQPGEEAVVRAQFRARAGEHVVLATLDPGREVGEEDEGNNGRLLVVRAEGLVGALTVPEPGPAVLLLAALALALLRARSPDKPRGRTRLKTPRRGGPPHG